MYQPRLPGRRSCLTRLSGEVDFNLWSQKLVECHASGDCGKAVVTGRIDALLDDVEYLREYCHEDEFSINENSGFAITMARCGKEEIGSQSSEMS